jgi:hypothetical protein
MRRRLLVGLAIAGLLAGAARAEVVLSMNDNHTVLDDKANQVAPDPVKPDTVDIIDVSNFPPRITATIDVPGSVVGPPLAIWVARDESWAIVTAATKADPQGKFGISPDDRVSVVKANPPRVIQTTTTGAGATVVRVSPAAPWPWSATAQRAPFQSSRSRTITWSPLASSTSARPPAPAAWCSCMTATI